MSPFGYASRFGGSWYYNTFLDMFTFLPYGGTYWSPFGYGFFSPYSIKQFYNPGNYYWYGGGGSPTASPQVRLLTRSPRLAGSALPPITRP